MNKEQEIYNKGRRMTLWLDEATIAKVTQFQRLKDINRESALQHLIAIGLDNVDLEVPKCSRCTWPHDGVKCPKCGLDRDAEKKEGE